PIDREAGRTDDVKGVQIDLDKQIVRIHDGRVLAKYERAIALTRDAADGHTDEIGPSTAFEVHYRAVRRTLDDDERARRVEQEVRNLGAVFVDDALESSRQCGEARLGARCVERAQHVAVGVGDGDAVEIPYVDGAAVRHAADRERRYRRGESTTIATRIDDDDPGIVIRDDRARAGDGLKPTRLPQGDLVDRRQRPSIHDRAIKVALPRVDDVEE